MSHVIYKGSNVILNRPLFQADGTTPILVSALAGASVQLVQKGTVMRTLVMGANAEVRAGEDGASLDLELTSTITNALNCANLMERWKIEIDDDAYIAEPDLNIKEVEIAEVLIAP